VFSRLVLYALTAVALALIGGVFLPWWVGSERSLAHVAGVLYRELQRGEALDGRDERVRRCLEAKTQITDEVLAGRRGLAEAAEAFREVNERLKGGDSGARRDPFADDEEAVYRNVIAWVRGRTSDDPQRQAAVVARLEEELQQFQEASAGGGL
jgi:hypothetical protein